MKCPWKSSAVAILLIGLVLVLPAGSQAQSSVNLSIESASVTEG